MAFISFFVLLIDSGCKTAQNTSLTPNGLVFKERKFKLLRGKVEGREILFSSLSDQAIIVEFFERRFKSFDGSFSILGTTTDTASSYFINVPLTGFYTLKGNNQIWMQWFSKTSWSMDFDKNEIRSALSKLFFSKGYYVYDGQILAFYKEANGKRDTIMEMKEIK